MARKKYVSLSHDYLEPTSHTQKLVESLRALIANTKRRLSGFLERAFQGGAARREANDVPDVHEFHPGILLAVYIEKRSP